MGFWLRFLSTKHIQEEVGLLVRISASYNKRLGGRSISSDSRELATQKIGDTNARISMLNRELAFRQKNKGFRGKLKRFFGRPR